MKRSFLSLAALASLGCGGGTTAVPAPAPSPSRPAPTVATTARPTAALPLPPVPQVDGALAIRVQYPSTNQVVTSRDSNFIFGSIGSGQASLTINGAPARVYPNGAFLAYVVNPPRDAPRYEMVVARGVDTARTTHIIRYPATPTASTAQVTPPPKREIMGATRADSLAYGLGLRLDSLRTAVGRLDSIGIVRLGRPLAAADTDAFIVGRPINGGTYKWFFLPGTVVPVVARQGGVMRVRLDRDLDVFIDSVDAPTLAERVPRRVVSNMRVRASSTGADVVIPMGSPAPYYVEEFERSIRITLYGAQASTDIINYASADTMVRNIEWKQLTNERSEITVNLRAAPFGYLVLWEGNAMNFKIRGRPAIDANRPLAGLTIAVDPGHPPIGATGPTGLYEANAVLAVGVRLKRILEERGANVVMTRTNDAPVALGERPIIARRANAHAFVSIHLNGLPDGINPFTYTGTGTYFFRAHSEPLARATQLTLVPQLGLPDLGINYDNLAVVRATWYPSVLLEGAFLMHPDQEAAMRTPEYQERYALGIANGLEDYFRALGKL